MLQRTTVSLNQEYLSYLKLLAIRRQKKLSELINDAVRAYLSNVTLKESNESFFSELAELKSKLNLDKSQLKRHIQKGRL